MSLRRNALIWILLTGVLGILGQWSASAALARAWMLPAALLLTALAYEAVVASSARVTMEVLAPARWPLGRTQPVELVFRQRARRSMRIEVVLRAPDDFAHTPRVQVLGLASGAAGSARLEAAARRLGRYAWPQPLLRVGGVLGFAWWSRPVKVEFTVTVIPDIVGRLDEIAGAHRAGERPTWIRGAGSENLDLRDYRRGDPLRVIDWKASARRRRLVSRDFSADQHLDIMVAIDAGRASGLGAGEVDRLSLCVNVAARLAQRATQLSDAVGVLAFAAQPLAALAPARGEAAVVRIRSLLAACRPQPSESNPVLAAARIRGLLERRSLVLILTDVQDASAGEQLLEAVRLLAPKHFPFIAGVESARIAALPRAAASEPIGAYRALAAIEYENTVAGNLRALRSLGAAALTARPENLDRTVFEAYREFRERRRV